jgi:NTE family protein
MKAIILSGGGARGAYQAGVITAVGEIAARLSIKTPFQIYTGISAGAINATFLAAGAHEFSRSAEKLSQLWSDLHSEQVFRTDAVSLGKIGFHWLGQLSLGGISNSSPNKSLLDTAPLFDLIRDNIEFGNIHKNISQQHLFAVAVTATDYTTNVNMTFVEGPPSAPTWERSRRKSIISRLTTEHVVASSAIPLLFAPTKINDRYYGDGCLRNLTTLSPALHLGADKLLVIGVRRHQTEFTDVGVTGLETPPSVARIANVLLNSVLLDGIEIDIERLTRINQFLGKVPLEHHQNLNFKAIDYVWISPSQDIGAVAASMSNQLPRIIRYLLKGLGPLKDASEIISYLLFEPDFCRRLIAMGYEDGMNAAERIEKFLTD